MKGGTRRPFPAMKARSTGRRLARLWPDEDAYDDRVTNQVNARTNVSSLREEGGGDVDENFYESSQSIYIPINMHIDVPSLDR